MNYELITTLEKFIENLNHPRKQAIARELIVNPRYQISLLNVFNENTLFIKDTNNNNVYKFLNYINSICNC